MQQKLNYYVKISRNRLKCRFR